MPAKLKKADIKQLKKVEWILTDVDDTLTWEGKLPPETLNALAKLQCVGVKVVAVTGACAGWCDQMARLWPLHGVIGENGAFWMRKDTQGFEVNSTTPLSTMREMQQKLSAELKKILSPYPDIAFAGDQTFRFCDVSINIAQDRTPVEQSIIDKIMKEIKKLTIDGQKVYATQSSIHVNVWLGEHSKQITAERYLQQFYKKNIPLEKVIYCGDSLNDESMFKWLPITFGVKNIESSLKQLKHKPTYITDHYGGYGFSELANKIINAKVG